MKDKGINKLSKMVPDIRFNGFEDDYELKTIGDLTAGYRNINRNNLKLESYSLTFNWGFIKQKEKWKRGGRTAVADKSKCIIIQPYSFAYDSTGLERKTIGYYQNINPGLISSMYVVFSGNGKFVNNLWLFYWLKSDVVQKDFKTFKCGGVRDYLRYGLFKEFNIMIPSINEQQKISELIKTIDNKINKSQKNLKYIKEFRNDLLNKMIVQRERERESQFEFTIN